MRLRSCLLLFDGRGKRIKTQRSEGEGGGYAGEEEGGKRSSCTHRSQKWTIASNARRTNDARRQNKWECRDGKKTSTTLPVPCLVTPMRKTSIAHSQVIVQGTETRVRSQSKTPTLIASPPSPLKRLFRPPYCESPLRRGALLARTLIPALQWTWKERRGHRHIHHCSILLPLFRGRSSKSPRHVIERSLEHGV
jgi:hypothetical protein